MATVAVATTTTALYLDGIATQAINTYDAANRVYEAMKLLPDVDWMAELEAAADRQVAEDPEANSMDNLADRVAQRLRWDQRIVRRQKA